MEVAVNTWLLSLSVPSTELQTFAKKLKRSYVVYGRMVLLPSEALRNLDSYTLDDSLYPTHLETLYELIAKHLNITHIGTSKSIPLHGGDASGSNILRSPTDFTPLYGDFGPSTCGKPPEQSDFNTAFWVTAKQNGIYQTWAPRWTMFSRGNISEKARLLTLPSVQSAVEQGEIDGRGCAAVDLYAGIGYFAFSYIKAGVSKVLCWDLNSWSIEGLKRGAAANRWAAAAVVDNDASIEEAMQDEVRLLVFHESNEYATRWPENMRSRLPPIRHVNCGLLPTSMGSWKVAIAVLDPTMGGWVHVHENFAVQEIERKAEEVRLAFQQLMDSVGHVHKPQVEHIHRLKSYAPGVMHCVIDIYIPSSTAS